MTRRVALVGQHGTTRTAKIARHAFRGVAKTWTGLDMSTSPVRFQLWFFS